MTTPTPPSARTLRLLTTALLLTLPLLACEAEYRNRGEGGDPCATDGDCAAGLSCVAFVCADGDGTYDVGVRPDARPDVTPGPDPGPDFDAGPGPDTTPPPDAALDTSSPPDASPDTGGGVCAPMERRCNGPRTEQICRPDGLGFVSRSCDEDETCAEGRCRANNTMICEPGLARCDNNQIVRCRDDGLDYVVVAECADDEVCVSARCERRDQPLPDLTFAEFDVQLGTYRPGDPFGIEGELINVGSDIAEGFTCSLWLSANGRLEPNRDILLDVVPAPSIEPLQGFPFSLSTRIPDNTPAGSYRAIAACDVLMPTVTEINEDNNTATSRGAITVITSDDDLPDLYWEFADFEADTVQTGEEVFFFASFGNSGASTGPFALQIALSREPDGAGERYVVWEEFLGGLGGGEAQGFEGLFRVPPDIEPGPWFVIFELDPFNTIAESNERNNAFSMRPLFVDSIDGTCEDDLDPNRSGAPRLLRGSGEYVDLVSCVPENDFYLVCLEPEQRLRLSLFFNHNLGDVDVNLIGEDGQTINGSYGINNQEYVEHVARREECLTVEVYVCCGGNRNTYNMDLIIEDP